tara:strand:- start:14530 stop:15021 length:492 start_codon:yes stop_codon:yes gene_type:complete
VGPPINIKLLEDYSSKSFFIKFKIMSKIKKELLDSYSSANYHVYASSPFIMNIGKFSNELSKLMKDLNFLSASFITAFNPYSQKLDIQENRSRNKVLELKIQAMQFQYIKGDGRCINSKEVGEESFLVFGISKKEATLLGEESEQNAIVFCEGEAIPDLLLLK